MTHEAAIPQRPARCLLGGLVLLCSLSSGCAVSPPRAWEKDVLARPAMTMGLDPLERRNLEHIYSSKENTTGGDELGGGGCGCN